MEQDLRGLLQNLREAIHEALAESEAVSRAMAALEDAGHCPSFRVDVATPAELEALEPTVDPAEYDEEFLRSLGISA